jgi:hypothetical protein
MMQTLSINSLTTPKRLTKRPHLKVAVMLLTALLALPLPTLAAAATDSASYAYIITTPQHFGDGPNNSTVAAVDRGQDHEYSFDLPGVDSSKVAILMLKTFDLDHNLNSFSINGRALRVRRHISGSEFFTDHVEVPAGILKETGNVLKISALSSSGQVFGELDDFIVDDVVLIYKTKTTSPLVLR